MQAGNILHYLLRHMHRQPGSEALLPERHLVLSLPTWSEPYAAVLLPHHRRHHPA